MRSCQLVWYALGVWEGNGSSGLSDLRLGEAIHCGNTLRLHPFSIGLGSTYPILLLS